MAQKKKKLWTRFNQGPELVGLLHQPHQSRGWLPLVQDLCRLWVPDPAFQPPSPTKEQVRGSCLLEHGCNPAPPCSCLDARLVTSTSAPHFLILLLPSSQSCWE